MVEQKQEIKAFFRVLNTDLEGAKPIVHALTKVHGISFSLANAICVSVNIPKAKQAGSLSDTDAKKIEAFVKELKFPKWMFNRRSDPETGVDKHLLSADLKFTKDNDIKMMRKVKSYKGLRHSLGQPVRGQRTRSHFRKGSAVGVQKQRIVASAAKPKEGGKK
jgi:small subunit ribosomal protein S13